MKCSFAECLKKHELIIGDCKYCQSKFCMKHRYASSHNCPKINEYKASQQALLKRKLDEGKCESNKLIKI
jgi:predicted nucleic acid binding AN1-type Zn finger protein